MLNLSQPTATFTQAALFKLSKAFKISQSYDQIQTGMLLNEPPRKIKYSGTFELVRGHNLLWRCLHTPGSMVTCTVYRQLMRPQSTGMWHT